MIYNIINSMNAIVISEPTAAQAYSTAINNFIMARDGEIIRSNNLKNSKFCRFRDEMDAKAQITDPYGTDLECTYPDCMNSDPDWSKPQNGE